MAAAVRLREDFDGPRLRALAKRTRDAGQLRRLLALAEIYDGRSRGTARLEQPHRRTPGHHVHRAAKMGASVISSAGWYKTRWLFDIDDVKSRREKDLTRLKSMKEPQNSVKPPQVSKEPTSELEGRFRRIINVVKAGQRATDCSTMKVLVWN